MTGNTDAGQEQAEGGTGAKKRGAELSREERRLMVPGGCRAYMRKTLVREFPEIVQGFIEAAKTGSCPHVKLVTELMRPIRQGKPRQKKGPAVRFLEKLDKEYAEREEQKRVEREQAEADEAAAVAVSVESTFV